MAWIVGTKTKVFFCSTEWVAQQVALDEWGSAGEKVRCFELPEAKLHIDFGGMISTHGTPKLFIDHDDGEFNFYAHQRRGIKAQLDKILEVGVGNLQDVVRLESANHTLCITLDHALHLLMELNSEIVEECERKALECCQHMVDAIRNNPSPYMQLSIEHDMKVN